MSDNRENQSDTDAQQITNNVGTGIGSTGDISGGNFNFGGGPQNNVTGTQNNVTGTQNNVRGNQYNSGRDQFIGNRNVSTGGGDIQDYGGVQGGVHNYGGVGGNVNSGSGSQTNTSVGSISGNQGNMGIGSGINQSYSAGGAGADPKVSSLLSVLEDLRDSLDDLTGEDRKSVRDPMTIAIKSLRSGQLDADMVSNALQQTSNALDDMDRQTERKALKEAAMASGLNIRLSLASRFGRFLPHPTSLAETHKGFPAGRGFLLHTATFRPLLS